MEAGKAARHRGIRRNIHLLLPLSIDPPQGHGAVGLFMPIVILTLNRIGITPGLLTGHWARKCPAVPGIYMYQGFT